MKKVNSADPDQTAPLGAGESGSTLFSQTVMTEYLWQLRQYLSE